MNSGKVALCIREHQSSVWCVFNLTFGSNMYWWSLCSAAILCKVRRESGTACSNNRCPPQQLHVNTNTQQPSLVLHQLNLWIPQSHTILHTENTPLTHSHKLPSHPNISTTTTYPKSRTSSTTTMSSSPAQPLASRDINTPSNPSPTKLPAADQRVASSPAATVPGSDGGPADGKPNNMEYHRQVLQSRLEEDR